MEALRQAILAAPDDENRTQLLTYLADLQREVNGKKYGLVFEEHREQIDEDLESHVPVLTEDKEAFIDNGGPMNFLIEGDNLASLSLLEKTHKGAIDLIYIDPPYNQGKKDKDDFIYNNNFVDENDAFRHSKWCSFMTKRLKLAKEILSKNGVIFISIDDNELSTLKMLCDEVFAEKNFISDVFVLDNLKGKANDNFITSVGSHLLVYARNKTSLSVLGFNQVENVFSDKIEKKYNKEDEFGFYNLITFKKTGQAKFREDRPNMFFPILQKDGVLFSIEEQEYLQIYNKTTHEFNDDFLSQLKTKYSDCEFILPIDKNGEYLRWTSVYDSFCKKMNVDIVYDNGVKQKTRPEATEMLQTYASGTPKSYMYKPSYSSGTDDLKNVFDGNVDFDFPKPLQLIIDIVKLYKSDNLTILDFFAGSGTTGHAVMKLNAEDGGNRKFILCTNNENNICREVTYERIKRVIAKEGYEASLKYMKVDFVPITDKVYYDYADELLKHVRELVELENGINFTGNDKIAIILSEKELDDFFGEMKAGKHKEVRSLYVAHNVLATNEQKTMMQERNIKFNIIPDYYYKEEAKQ